MNEIVQYVLTGIIVALAVALASRSISRALRNKRTALTACAACKLKDVCRRPECRFKTEVQKIINE